MKKEIPLLFGNPKDKAFFQPCDWIDYTKKINKKKIITTKNCIISFSTEFMDEIKKQFKTKKMNMYNDGNGTEFIEFKYKNKKIYAIYFGIGSAFAGVILEQLIAQGAKNIIIVGSAGSIQKNINVGDVIVINKAIRDEGVSYHYKKPGKYAYADKKLTEKLEKILKLEKINYTIGTAWTTDAPYRETIKKLKKYQKEGVLCVEMEAAALFAIAEYRKVNITLLINISDDLSSLEWVPHFHDYLHKLSNKERIKIACETLIL